MRFPVALGDRTKQTLSERKGSILCFAAALVVFGIESIAWPLSNGRDAATYLMYYVDMWHAHPTYPALMLYRTPLAPLFYGPLLQVGGAALAEAAMGIAFAVSVLAFAMAAAEFGRAAAVLTAAAVLAYPGYGALFHQMSSDPIFALAFSLWTLAVIRAIRRPQTWRFALAGLLLVLLVLARPESQILLAFAVVPLLILRAPWRERLVRSGAFLGVAVCLLAAWSGYNDLRYGTFVIARDGWAEVPFYRVFEMEKIVRPQNGPASRRLAAAVQRDLLGRPTYARLRIRTPDEYFEVASDRMWSDVVVIVDRTWGWGSDYTILRNVALEAIDRHPRLYARDVANSVWDELRFPYQWAAPQPASPLASSARRPAIAAAAVRKSASVDGSDVGGTYWWLASTPSGRPPARERVARLDRTVDKLELGIPNRAGSRPAAAALNWISHVYPWAAAWIAVALGALALRRPRGGLAVLVVIAAALGMIVFTELGEPPALEYGLPFAPIWILAAAAALTAPRHGRG
jgi:Dolichyl-phosphate-mannose-protein mannosyltransferase